MGRAPLGGDMRLSRGVATVGSALLILGGAGLTAGTTTAQAAGPTTISPTAVLIHPNVFYAGTVSTSPPTLAQCEATFRVACYGPAQIQKAYDLQPLFASGITGKGETIVIVDSYGSPTIGHDLDVFDRTYGLLAPLPLHRHPTRRSRSCLSKADANRAGLGRRNQTSTSNTPTPWPREPASSWSRHRHRRMRGRRGSPRSSRPREYVIDFTTSVTSSPRASVPPRTRSRRPAHCWPSGAPTPTRPRTG